MIYSNIYEKFINHFYKRSELVIEKIHIKQLIYLYFINLKIFRQKVRQKNYLCSKVPQDQEQFKMKFVLFAMSAVAALCGGQFTLDVSRNIKIQQNNDVSIPLKCENSQGAVSYTFKGLPQGLRQSAGVIKGKTNISNGRYPVLVDASDQGGNRISQIVVLNVESSSSSSSNQQQLSSTSASSGSLDLRGSSSLSSSSSSKLLGSSGSTGSSGSSIDSILSRNYASTSVSNGSNSTSSSSSGINSLLQSLGIKSKSNQNQVNSSYPVRDYPTGGSNNIPNTTPSKIFTTQATKSSYDKNIITIDQTKKNAIFQRQLNANKVIANLLKIIEQIRANANAGKSDLPQFERALQQSIEQQRAIQAKISQVQANEKKLTGAITNIKATIQNDNDLIEKIKKEGINFNNIIASKQQEIKNLKDNLKDAENNLDKLNKQKIELNGQLNEVNKKISNIKIQISNSQRQLTRLRTDLESIDLLITNITTKISQQDVEIADLRRKIERLVQQRNIDQNQLDRLTGLKRNGPTLIRKLQDQINSNKNQLTPFEQQINRLNSQIKKTQQNFEQWEKTVKLNVDNIKKLGDDIIQIQKQFEQLNAHIENILVEQKTHKSQLQILINYQPQFKQLLQNVYLTGNDVNDRVRTCRQNLNALVLRIQTQQSKLVEATGKLQQARRQKQRADLEMQNLLQERSDALPYATISSNDSGFTNNYSFRVNNQGLRQSDDFSCDMRGRNGVNISGVIENVYGKQLSVRCNGQLVSVNTATCSQLLGPRSGYTPSRGDNITLYGYSGANNSINAVSAKCGLN